MIKSGLIYLIDNIRWLGWLIILAVFLIVLPYLVAKYQVDVLIMLLINIILVVSFRLITTTGGWSLAHVPMMGCGAYATALLTAGLGFPFWFSLPLSGLAAALAALIISYPLARTRGFAFFVASFAAGDSLRLCWTRFKVPFGGHKGLTNIPVPEFFSGVDLSEPMPYYFLTLVLTIICLAVMYRLDKSRIGHTWKAIDMNEDLSRSLGINVTFYKILAFVIGSFFAGVAGVLLAHRLWAVVPAQFGFVTTLYLLVWVVFGGTRTFAGAILGVVMLTFLREVLKPFLEWVPMIFGAIIILTLIFFPEGLEGLPRRFSPWLSRQRLISELEGQTRS
ncbi:MAG: branched-chain amino acid ABC transporter permease [Thermodesulfobacteriota bacterium]